MAQTTNYYLLKPDIEDYYNIEHDNENMDKIDAALKQNADSINTHTTNTDIHITPTERNNWNNKETPEDAQAKANTAKDDAISIAAIDATNKVNAVQGNLDSHTSNNSHHVSDIDRINWDDKADKQDIYSQNGFAVTTGTATALVATLSPAPTSLYTGMRVTVKLHVAITANCTLNVNGKGAKAVYQNSTDRLTKAKAGDILSLIYDGSNFILASGGGGGELNVFVQLDEPDEKEGIWYKDVGSIDNVITDTYYYESGEYSPKFIALDGEAVNNALSGSSDDGFLYFMPQADVNYTVTTKRIFRYHVHDEIAEMIYSFNLIQHTGAALPVVGFYIHNNFVYLNLSNSYSMNNNMVYETKVIEIDMTTDTIRYIYGTASNIINGAHTILGIWNNHLITQSPSVSNYQQTSVLHKCLNLATGIVTQMNYNGYGFIVGGIYHTLPYSGPNGTSRMISRYKLPDLTISELGSISVIKESDMLSVVYTYSNNVKYIDGFIYFGDTYNQSNDYYKAPYTLDDISIVCTRHTIPLQFTNNSFPIIKSINEGIAFNLRRHAGGTGGTSTNRYVILMHNDKPYPSNTVIIKRTSEKHGNHWAKLFPNDITGPFSAMLTPLDDFGYKGNTKFTHQNDKYVGDGQRWNKIN